MVLKSYNAPPKNMEIGMRGCCRGRPCVDGSILYLFSRTAVGRHLSPKEAFILDFRRVSGITTSHFLIGGKLYAKLIRSLQAEVPTRSLIFSLHMLLVHSSSPVTSVHERVHGGDFIQVHGNVIEEPSTRTCFVGPLCICFSHDDFSEVSNPVHHVPNRFLHYCYLYKTAFYVASLKLQNTTHVRRVFGFTGSCSKVCHT